MAKGKLKKGKPEKHERLTRKQRRAMEKSSSNTDPEDLDAQLRSLGLCTKNITGDGNCLFRSLSDQYYGQDGNHKAIRQEICQYLRDNEETYKFFVEDDQSFEHHVECMSQNATFGGNMELVAFAKLKKVDIKVYQPGLIYVINGVDEEEEIVDDNEERQVLHIAYHSWEHYDSVRNIDGPYTGPPEIKATEKRIEVEDDEDEKEEENDLDSKEKVVRNACPNTSIRKIRRLLNKYKGDPDKVIDALYELENKSNESENAPPLSDSTTTTEAVSIEPTEAPEVTQPEENIVAVSVTKTEDKHQQQQIDDKIDASEPQSTDEVVNENKEIGIAVPHEKAKKPSAAERKREAKRRQKENKLMKERAKAARKAKYKEQEKVDNEKSSSVDNTTSITQPMKEMYI